MYTHISKNASSLGFLITQGEGATFEIPRTRVASSVVQRHTRWNLDACACSPWCEGFAPQIASARLPTPSCVPLHHRRRRRVADQSAVFSSSLARSTSPRRCPRASRRSSATAARSSPAASASAWPSRGRSRTGRRCCCSTSRQQEPLRCS